MQPTSKLSTAAHFPGDSLYNKKTASAGLAQKGCQLSGRAARQGCNHNARCGNFSPDQGKERAVSNFGVQTQCTLLETQLGGNGKRITAVSLAMCAAALATAQGTRVLLAMLQALPLQDFYKVVKDPDSRSGRLSLPARPVAMQRLAFQPPALRHQPTWLLLCRRSVYALHSRLQCAVFQRI